MPSVDEIKSWASLLSGFKIFLLGVFGSIVVEIVRANKTHETGRPFPVRYKRLSYYVNRAALAISSGVVAAISDTNNSMLAVYIGVATPFMIESVFEKARDGQFPEVGGSATPQRPPSSTEIQRPVVSPGDEQRPSNAR